MSAASNTREATTSARANSSRHSAGRRAPPPSSAGPRPTRSRRACCCSRRGELLLGESQQAGDVADRAQRRGGHRDPLAVAGAVGVDHGRRGDRQLVAGAFGHRAQLVVDDDLPLDEPEQGLEEGEVDPLAVEVGVVVTAVQGGEDGVGAHQAGHGVAVREAGVDGRAVGKPGQVDDAAARLAHLAEAGGVGLRRGGAEAGDLQQYGPGVDPVHGVPVESPVAQAPGAQGDDDDVRPGDEPVGDGRPASWCRSRVTERLLRPATLNHRGTPSRRGPMARAASPAPGGSTCTTSAPGRRASSPPAGRPPHGRTRPLSARATARVPAGRS